jgi:FkbH-like protein
MLSHQLPDLDYGRLVKSRAAAATSPGKSLRIALLADAATQQLVPLLSALLARAEIRAEIYEGAFDAIELEAYNPDSRLYQFNPEVVVILNAVQALRMRFGRRSSDAAGFAGQTVAAMTGVWDQIQLHSRAQILQSNFALPRERTFGNLDVKIGQSFFSAVHAINTRLAAAANGRAGVLINDVEAVASWVGRQTFFDDRFWDLWKSFCALDHLPRVAQNVADILVAVSGRVVKCVVCDLDNTLWGGVIGDDGLNGIKLNAHGDGEAFYRLQLFLKELHGRGILLAVCSKNDESNAKLPFIEHPEMVLKFDDIVAFRANWEDKAGNIRAIREQLNIGFDSMVFLDDNPFERNLVRELLPGIIVPELPDDPSEYVSFLSELNLFESASFSSEDLQRAEMYKREAERREAAAGYASVEDFMRSLDMRIEVARFDPYHLPRIAQLLQRSNQFNLTTRRLSEAECAAMMREERFMPMYAKLSDRLGDHGLISIVILELLPGEIAIRDWLMSCRVLARGVEQYLMNEVVTLARARGASLVSGEYIPTAKNGMVREFFRQFGFVQSSNSEGRTFWSLDPAAYQPLVTYIQPARSFQAAT